jgi:hypothetical protein
MCLASMHTMGAEKDDRFPDCYIPCVVALGYVDSSWHHIGTGFLMYNYDGKLNYLVSNKHVFAKCDSLVQKLGQNKVRVKLKIKQGTVKELMPTFDEKGGWMEMPLHFRIEGKQAWVGHPDPHVDIAVMYFDPMPAMPGLVLYLSTALPLGQSVCVPMDSLCIAQEVLFLGFPLGIGTDLSPIPVVRCGIIAYMDAKSKSLLLDAQVFPGSSGSPVFTTGDSWGTPPLVAGGKLVGIISGYRWAPTQMGRKRIKKSANEQLDSMLVPLENAGLCVVYSSDLILETIEHFSTSYLHNKPDSTKPD